MSYDLASTYMFVKQIVVFEGYSQEIEWQERLDFQEVSEAQFLRELAWVILSSGMREQVVRKIFRDISPCFHDWASARSIVMSKLQCEEHALLRFRNTKKISAIIRSAEIIDQIGYAELKRKILSSPTQTLMQFPFIGPITSYHLAKNIGISTAKPDRHLVRIAKVAGYCDVNEFCGDISSQTGDSVPVVDLVFWRFANIEPEYLTVLKSVSK